MSFINYNSGDDDTGGTAVRMAETIGLTGSGTHTDAAPISDLPGRDHKKQMVGSKVETAAGGSNAVVLPGDRAILLFNHECALCSWLGRKIIALDDPMNGGDQRLDERPIGFDPDVLKKLNPDLTIWAAYRAPHVLMPDGSMKEGADAIAEVLRRLPATRWFTPLLQLKLLGTRPFNAVLSGAFLILDKIRPALGCACGPVPWWLKPLEWSAKTWVAIIPKRKSSKKVPADALQVG